MLAAEYAASRTPKGLKRLILAGTRASTALFSQGLDLLLSRFPEGFVRTIRQHEADGTTQSKEYKNASMAFYKRHICTVDPWPKELIQSFMEVSKNPTVNHTMYVCLFASCTFSHPFDSESVI